MISVLLALAPVLQAQKLDAPTVIKGLFATYAKVKTAKMSVSFSAGPGLKPAAIVELQYKSPNFIWASTASQVGSMPSFIFVSDGNNVISKGRPGAGKKKFSLQTVQDDGPPVYKETLALWDIKRQFGERAKKNTYTARRFHEANSDWIELRENENNGTGYSYFIEPKTGLIKRTAWYQAGSKIAEYKVTKQEINGKLTASFKV